MLGNAQRYRGESVNEEEAEYLHLKFSVSLHISASRCIGLKLEIEYSISTSITTLAHLFKSTKYFKHSPFKWYQQFLGLTIRQNGSHHVEAHEKDISDILFQFRSALHWEICSTSRQKQQKSAYKLIGLRM